MQVSADTIALSLHLHDVTESGLALVLELLEDRKENSLQQDK